MHANDASVGCVNKQVFANKLVSKKSVYCELKHSVRFILRDSLLLARTLSSFQYFHLNSEIIKLKIMFFSFSTLLLSSHLVASDNSKHVFFSHI